MMMSNGMLTGNLRTIGKVVVFMSAADVLDRFNKIVEEDLMRKRLPKYHRIVLTLILREGTDPVCEKLGTVSYNHQGNVYVARQTATGAIVYEGKQFTGISDWLKNSFAVNVPMAQY